jgi:putative ABC transport system permease protein
VAYFAVFKLLQNFAYRIRINPLIFVLAGLMALMIALVTVSYQSFHAARTDPVNSLKYE